ncbi:MAG: pyrroline-5-carboxylate reductase [Alphaproteobacteria bacterium]|nr:pyrroline-5-carboxylate reductase [Alphaproteobacteria bacterium]
MNSTNNHNKRILLVGCGKMGSALLNGWKSSNIKFECTVIDPQNIPEPSTISQNSEQPHAHKVRYVKSYKECTEYINKADIVLLAVKPQIMHKVCADLSPLISKTALILSIAAGQTISNFENSFGSNQPIVRAMPNTPAAIGKGITVAIENSQVTKEQKETATTLLSATGSLEWIKDENLLNAVTSLSGSGPAYIFYLIETLAIVGKEIGIPSDLANKLARQTVIGSAALADHENEISASTLRENVTSQKGTTQAALNILMNGELKNILKRTLEAAKKRSEEL